MSNLENNCLAVVTRLSSDKIKYGEIVQCINSMPTGAVINNGRLGYQKALQQGMWWVNNRNGHWLEYNTNLVRLRNDPDDDEIIKIVGKPPSRGVSA